MFSNSTSTSLFTSVTGLFIVFLFLFFIFYQSAKFVISLSDLFIIVIVLFTSQSGLFTTEWFISVAGLFTGLRQWEALEQQEDTWIP